MLGPVMPTPFAYYLEFCRVAAVFESKVVTNSGAVTGADGWGTGVGRPTLDSLGTSATTSTASKWARGALTVIPGGG